MNEFLNDDQIAILIAALTDTIQAKADEAEMANSYSRMIDSMIDRQNKEIAELKAKLKAKAPKVTKVTKVAKEPKVIAPAKRKPGRPKKGSK
jgi:hypothetical protein